MRTKLLEVRDRATFIPVFAMTTEPANAEQSYLLRRAGYGLGGNLIMVGRLQAGECQYNEYSWRDGARTMREAHKYITENFESLKDGDVIDVEFILGETDKPKNSEREDNFYV